MTEIHLVILTAGVVATLIGGFITYLKYLTDKKSSIEPTELQEKFNKCSTTHNEYLDTMYDNYNSLSNRATALETLFSTSIKTELTNINSRITDIQKVMDKLEKKVEYLTNLIIEHIQSHAHVNYQK